MTVTVRMRRTPTPNSTTNNMQSPGLVRSYFAAGMDVGFSEDTTAVYFQIGNAWFRP